jgi:predicted ATPase
VILEARDNGHPLSRAFFIVYDGVQTRFSPRFERIMLTRLKVKGFKNLVDIDVRFGPFTCIAGVNGVGKSNLFDAIHFLSLLSDLKFLDAARFIRDPSGQGDVPSLFHRVGEGVDAEMEFEAEMIVPPSSRDDLGQKAEAGITFLKYRLMLRLRAGSEIAEGHTIELRHEELTHINLNAAKAQLWFPHSKSWRQSAVSGRRTGGSFISTAQKESGETVISWHQDGHAGRPHPLLASNAPRTLLSSASAEYPTALLARREMQSWRLLQFEPSSLRKHDEFNAPTSLGRDGSHLPATLYRLTRQSDGAANGHAEPRVYSRVSNRLAELIRNVRGIGVDRDEKRRLLTLQLTDLDGTVHPAHVLSDGTLRFLALAVLELDPQMLGLICLEEPENGIHPERIPAMLRLLKDIAADPEVEAGPDNPLRQVIINTHSPSVVSQVDDADLLVADSMEHVEEDGTRFQGVRFSCLPDTWREEDGVRPIARGTLGSYLNPVPPPLEHAEPASIRKALVKPRPVKDRRDLQPCFEFPEEGTLA